jgi:adenylate cyclase, class 2
MNTEIEAKFLNIDHGEIREKLKSLNATLVQPKRLMRRTMFDFPDKRLQRNESQERLRVRDEGDKITVTYKLNNDSNYPYEIETTVGSFEEMEKLFTAIGLEKYSYQESKRETWQIGNVKVELDEWPWLNPYIEIEGFDEGDIKYATEKLGFNWHDAKYGSVDTVYALQYPEWNVNDSIGDEKEVKFDSPIPKWIEKGKNEAN